MSETINRKLSSKRLVIVGAIFCSAIVFAMWRGNGADRPGDGANVSHDPTLPGAVIQLQTAGEFANIIDSNDYVMVDFYADWCPPCKVLKPTLNQLATEYKANLATIAVDVDKFGDIAKEFEISGIPTIILFNRGAAADRFVGLQPKTAYAAAIDKMIVN